MVNVIKLRKGLDIRLKGVAGHQDVPVRRGSDFALCPADYQGVTPKVVVKEGDRVLAGDAGELSAGVYPQAGVHGEYTMRGKKSEI